tara:strand:- start:212 stop:478 length:267 start_codon:yes stop_codon:yes gene_type:complete
MTNQIKLSTAQREALYKMANIGRPVLLPANTAKALARKGYATEKHCQYVGPMWELAGAAAEAAAHMVEDVNSPMWGDVERFLNTEEAS